MHNACAPEHFLQRFAVALAEQIPQRHLHTRLREMMPPDTFHVRLKIIRVLEVFAKNQRRDEILENVPRGSSRFIVIARLARSDTFAVPSQPFGLQGDNDTLTIRLAPKGCFKRRYQWHGDVM